MVSLCSQPYSPAHAHLPALRPAVLKAPPTLQVVGHYGIRAMDFYIYRWEQNPTLSHAPMLVYASAPLLALVLSTVVTFIYVFMHFANNQLLTMFSMVNKKSYGF